MMLIKIISGGQTGADMGGLRAGRALNIPTGGSAPHGWKKRDRCYRQLSSHSPNAILQSAVRLQRGYVPRE